MGHVVSNLVLEGLETKDQVHSQPWSSNKTSGHQGLGELPQLAILISYMLSHMVAGKVMLSMTPCEENKSMSGTSLKYLPMAVFICIF